MDKNIVRAILRSSGKFMETLTDEKDLDKLIENVPVLDQNTSAALSTSLTDLLTYKISPEAHQRYAVRIKLIEMLREWIQPPLGLSSYQTFNQSNNILQLCQGIIIKYFSTVDFDDVNSSKDFFIFGKELINLANRNSLFISCVKSFVEKLTNSNMSFNIHELVKIILDHEDIFQLEFLLIEKLYVINHMKLIEEPLIDCFLTNLNNKNIESFITTNKFDKLINNTAKSPKIFQIISGILKTLFLHLDYSSLVLNYIQFILKKLLFNCPDKKNILNLYPMNLQSCVILLKINPNYHTKKSKELTLQTLKNIYLENMHQVLTLLTHYPEWIDLLLINISDFIDN